MLFLFLFCLPEFPEEDPTQSSALNSCSAEGLSQIMDYNLMLFQRLAPDPRVVLLKLPNVVSMSKHIIIQSWLNMDPSHLMASLI